MQTAYSHWQWQIKSARAVSIGLLLWKGIRNSVLSSAIFTFQEKYRGQKSAKPFQLAESMKKLKVKKPKIETLLDAYRTTKYPLIHGNNCCIILYNNEIKESNTNILLYLLAG